MIRRTALACALAALAALALPGAARSFGTINGKGQHAEHEQITRAALWCKADAAPRECFGDTSMFYVAGGPGPLGAAQGAVGAPDVGLDFFNPAAHCDDADYFDFGRYPRSRAAATQALLACRGYALTHLDEAVKAAKGMLDKHGRLIRRQVDPVQPCRFVLALYLPAKCEAIADFGRTLHTVEDFYSHTTWAGEADPVLPPELFNPPGLGRSDLTPLFDWNAPPSVPPGLSGGCFDLVHPKRCDGRVTHADVNKDEGHIDPRSGRATAPATPRGKIGHNFAAAVSDAIREAARQWGFLQKRLVDAYGKRKGKLMICALTRDHPEHDCRLKLTVKGVAHLHWTVDDTSHALCDNGRTTGRGGTTIHFESLRPVYADPVDLDPAAGGHGVVLPTRALFGSSGKFTSQATGCASGPGGPPVPIDCGGKTVRLPLEVIARREDRITLENHGDPDDPYRNCPDAVATRGQVGPNDGELDDDDLYDQDVEKIVVSGRGRHRRVTHLSAYGGSGTQTLDTRLDWTLTIAKKPRS